MLVLIGLFIVIACVLLIRFFVRTSKERKQFDEEMKRIKPHWK